MEHVLENPSLKLSPLEQEVVQIIQAKGPVSISDIAKELLPFWAGYSWIPQNPGVSVVSAIRQINRKFEKAKLATRIDGPNRGRYGKVVNFT